VTSRGMREPEMRRIGAWLEMVVTNVDDEKVIARVAGEVREFSRQFPAPGLVQG
jgi:glycine hydroxymethyltransferase